MTQPPPLVMEVYVDGGIAAGYPVVQGPVVAIRGGGLPRSALRALTRAAIRGAKVRSRSALRALTRAAIRGAKVRLV